MIGLQLAVMLIILWPLTVTVSLHTRKIVKNITVSPNLVFVLLLREC